MITLTMASPWSARTSNFTIRGGQLVMSALSPLPPGSPSLPNERIS